jgi:MbtH protein
MNQDDDANYLVVINDEEQYSIWPDYKKIPPGWRAEGFEGRKAVCLDHIDTVWVDMRRKSAR